MSKIAFIADVHVGNFQRFGGATLDGINSRCQLTLDTLNHAVKAAKTLGAEKLFICGDLFHVKRPEPAVISAVQEALAQASVIVIPGNHDMLDATAMGGNTACAPLVPIAKVIEEPVEVRTPVGKVLCVPFAADMPMAEYVVACTRGVKDCKILATHVGVVDDTDPPWLRNSKDAMHAGALFMAMADVGIELAVVGNYHRHRRWEQDGMTIVQCGALNPTGFGDSGLDGFGSLIFYDGNKIERIEIPGPRFITDDTKPQDLEPELVEQDVLFLRSKNPAAYSDAKVRGVETVVDEPVNGAPSVELVDVKESVAAFVDSMQRRGLAPQDIVARVLGYLLP